MFLIVDDVLAPETAVVFDVALENGVKVIRAEGRVEHDVPAEGTHPGGLRVRFRRFGAQTKTFIDRAVRHAERRSAAPLTQRSASVSPAPASVGPRSVPPPLPSRTSRPAGVPPSERVPQSTRDGSQRPPPLPPRRSMTPPAGTPTPFDSAAKTESVRAPAEGPRVRAEAEPILPDPVRAPKKTLPSFTIDPETFEPVRAAERPDDEPHAPPTPPVGLIDQTQLAPVAPTPSVIPAVPSAPPPLAEARKEESPPPSSRAESEASGVHSLASETLARPRNRDELLARLRERSKGPESNTGDQRTAGSRGDG
jgi:hypothetical protein